MSEDMVQPDNHAGKSNAALKNALCMPDNKGKTTDTLIIFNNYCFIIPYDFVKCFTATVNKSWGTPQRIICHYDLFSQTVRLKKATSK